MAHQTDDAVPTVARCTTMDKENKNQNKSKRRLQLAFRIRTPCVMPSRHGHSPTGLGCMSLTQLLSALCACDLIAYRYLLEVITAAVLSYGTGCFDSPRPLLALQPSTFGLTEYSGHAVESDPQDPCKASCNPQRPPVHSSPVARGRRRNRSIRHGAIQPKPCPSVSTSQL